MPKSDVRCRLLCFLSPVNCGVINERNGATPDYCRAINLFSTIHFLSNGSIACGSSLPGSMDRSFLSGGGGGTGFFAFAPLGTDAGLSVGGAATLPPSTGGSGWGLKADAGWKASNNTIAVTVDVIRFCGFFFSWLYSLMVHEEKSHTHFVQCLFQNKCSGS